MCPCKRKEPSTTSQWSIPSPTTGSNSTSVGNAWLEEVKVMPLQIWGYVEKMAPSNETINFTWMFHIGKVKDRQGSVGVVTNEYSLPRICLNGRGFPWQVKNKGAKGTRAVTKIQVTWKRKAVIFLWIWLFRNSGLETMSTLLLATYIACPYEINQIEASSFLQST